MNNELKDYEERTVDKKRRTMQGTSPGDMNSENGNRSFTSCQSTAFILGCLSTNRNDLNGTSNNGNNSNVDECDLNGCNFETENVKNLRSSICSRDRAALYRNIYNSSSSEDEDEHCVYTYKGAEAASDSPETFLHSGVNGRNNQRLSARSSPEMDFLEMDFDPGPSNGQDSDSDSCSLYRHPTTSNSYQNDSRSTSENIDRAVKNECDTGHQDAYDENANCCVSEAFAYGDALVKGSNPNSVENLIEEVTLHENPCCSKILKADSDEVDSSECATGLTETTLDQPDLSSDEESSIKNHSMPNHYSKDNNASNRHDCKSSEESDSEDIAFIPSGYHPVELEDMEDNLPENFCDISLINSRIGTDFACYNDLLSLDPSYSISTVINVMKILKDSQYNEREELVNLLRPKQVTENTPLVEYLFMRSVQNANEVDLQSFASIISENKLHSRFFSTYPDANFDLVEWLYSWMRKGAVPVVTRNMQERGTLPTKNIISNPWRHNVVSKLESPYIHVLNPSEKILDYVLRRQLSQPSLLHVKKKHILRKWHSKVDLRLLMRANHNRWYNENVLGQVATIIRENDNATNYTKYVRIPSNCHCGITLFVPSENFVLCREVDEAEELTTTMCY